MKSLLMLALLFQGADGGVITGRLLTVDGKPAAAVRVAAMAVDAPGAVNDGALFAITVTDNDGKYRLERVPAGRYYITAGLVAAPSYYPGTGAASSAKEVQVTAGSVIEKMDFAMAVPDGFTVSGRLAMTPTIAPTNKVSLFSRTTGDSREETLRPDGTFEINKVTPGEYMLVMPVGVPNQSFAVTDRDVTGLVLGNATGVRVIGTVKVNGSSASPIPTTGVRLSGTPNVLTAGAPPPGGLAGAVVAIGSSTTSPSYSTRSNSDGSFEFLGVAPGTYSLRATTPGAPENPTTLVVAGKDIAGLEISVPYSREVTGRVVMADGSNRGLPQTTNILNIQAQFSNGSVGAPIAADGSFRILVIQGDVRLNLRNLPLGFRVDSITSNGSDVLKNGLHIEPGQASDEIRITLATVPLDSIKGVRFSGRVTGLPTGNYTGGKVTLSAADSTTSNLETPLKPDGTFEFAKVPPGEYRPQTDGIPGAGPQLGGLRLQVFVGADDISGFQIPLSLRTMVNGKITVVDESGRTRTDVMPSGQVMFQRSSGTTGSSLRPDGTLGLALETGEYTMRIDRMPPQFTVQSITSGSVDLMKNPLKVEFNAPPPEIQVRVLYKP